MKSCIGRDIWPVVNCPLFALLLLFAFTLNAQCGADDANAEERANGLTGAKPYFEPNEAVKDVIKVRYKFRVVANESPTMKIIFGNNRFCGEGPDTYLIEANVYSNGVRFEGDVRTTFPEKGEWVQTQASLHAAVADYNKKGKTGAKTLSAKEFPRQTFLIDGIGGLWKTSLISQMNLNEEDVGVEISRGDIVTEKDGWKPIGSLDEDQYRQWNVAVTIKDKRYDVAFALPDAGARYLTAHEFLFFTTEFLHTDGLFQVAFWDCALQREGKETWQPITQWRVTRHEGNTRECGVRLAKRQDSHVLEFSNDGQGGFFENDSVMDLASGKVVSGNSPERAAQNMQTLTTALEKLSLGWDQPCVDHANSIFAKGIHTEKDWAAFFGGYFDSHKGTAKLWEYLFYPSFGWLDDATHRKLQVTLNDIAKVRVRTVFEKHSDDLEIFLTERTEERADLAFWLLFLKTYGEKRDATLRDKGNSEWMKQLIAEYPKRLSPSALTDFVDSPQTAWLKTEILSLAK